MDRSTIRGLTLTRPWPFAFVNGPLKDQKRVENRTWPVPAKLRGCYVALHAGKSWDEGDREFIAHTLKIDVPPRADHPDSHIFAVCRVKLCVSGGDPRIPQTQRKWAFGPYVWLCEDFVQLQEPVPCKGAQGLWTFDSRLQELAELRALYWKSLRRQQ